LAADIDFETLMKGKDMTQSLTELKKLCVLAGFDQSDIKSDDVELAMMQTLQELDKGKSPLGTIKEENGKKDGAGEKKKKKDRKKSKRHTVDSAITSSLLAPFLDDNNSGSHKTKMQKEKRDMMREIQEREDALKESQERIKKENA
jgi:hypothetical protein